MPVAVGMCGFLNFLEGEISAFSGEGQEPAMAEHSHRLIFSTLTPTALLPPSNLNGGSPPTLLWPQFPAESDPVLSVTPSRRRATLNLLSLAAVLIPSAPSAAAGLSLGIPGPKEWLKEQKKKSSKFLLAPIEDSRKSLQIAYRMITEEMGPETSGSGEIRRLLNSAARDCVAGGRNSIVAFQAQSGVEVCTFRLLVKNAASLLDNNDPVKLETEALLDKLIRSFSSVGDLVDNNDLGITSDRQKVEVGLKDTMSALDNFEEGIKHCIGI